MENRKEKPHALFLDSECLNGYLHRFSIQQQYPEGVVEICEICKERRFFKVVDGRVNNVEYLGSHARQALLPQHPLFYHEYKYEYKNR